MSRQNDRAYDHRSVNDDIPVSVSESQVLDNINRSTPCSLILVTLLQFWKVAKYCDLRVCVSVCLICMSVGLSSPISKQNSAAPDEPALRAASLQRCCKQKWTLSLINLRPN